MEQAERLLDLLTTLSRRNPIRDPLAAVVEEMELTPSQLHTLAWIGIDGPLTMGELARRLCITDKTITGVVDRLERAGMVRRVREDEDRRIVRVALAEKGRQVHEVMRAGLLKKIARFLELLEPGESAALFGFLERLQKASEASTDTHARNA